VVTITSRTVSPTSTATHTNDDLRSRRTISLGGLPLMGASSRLPPDKQILLETG
jgi:hypothetical protein